MRFADIPGHEDVKLRLRAMAEAGRMPHALLLHGPAGSGKLALARALAQYLCCTDRHDGDSCGHCQQCLRHQSMQHIDTHYVFPVVKGDRDTRPPVSDDYMELWRDYAGNNLFPTLEGWSAEFASKRKNPSPMIYVGESASLLHKLSFATHAGSTYRTVILWAAERMNEETANKLLKVIEEPAEGTVFILVSDNAEALLPTVRSRLQSIAVPAYAEATVAEYLQSRDIDRPVALEAARLSDGNMAAALDIARQGQRTAAYLELFKRMMRNSYQRRVADMRRWSADVAAMARDEQLRFLLYAARLIRENFIYNTHCATLSAMDAEEESFSRNFAPYVNERNAESFLRLLTDAYTDIAGNASAKVVCFDVAVKVSILIRR